MKTVAAFAAKTDHTPLAPFSFQRRDPAHHDVEIEILYCGVCHTDLHYVKNEWKSTIYPVVPGHEIVGRVTRIGNDVKKFKPGDLVAVGCMVDSCRKCPNCKEHLEQYCDKGSTFTYNSIDNETKQTTFGGYSTSIVVNEDFVLRVPSKFKEKDLAGVAPLLCAGITTYSPLRHWKTGKDKWVGVVALGGLGHMAVKLAKAMGAHVVLFTSSPKKIEDGKRLGADEVVVSSDQSQLEKYSNRFDLIIDTATVSHSLDTYLHLLKRDGALCLLGVPPQPHPPHDITDLIFKRAKLTGSLIGGIEETQEMLDFCADHGILSEIEIIPIQKINEAYERMLKNDVRYRFVIDVKNSLK